MLLTTPESTKVFDRKPVLLTFLAARPWAITNLNWLGNVDLESFDHCIRTGFIAGELTGDNELVTTSALLHDVGKVGTPGEILGKKRLTADERKLLDTHPKVGYVLIWPFSHRMAEIVVGHHEFQARPYPRRTVRENERKKIYRYRRTVALADVTDALLSKRAYKEGWSMARAKQFLSETFSQEEIDAATEAFLKLR